MIGESGSASVCEAKDPASQPNVGVVTVLYNSEPGLMEFLESQLGENYLCFYLYIPAPSDFDAFYVYDLSE